MQKLLATLAVLAVITTPAFAWVFDSDNGTGNVLSFGAEPGPAQNEKISVVQVAMRAYDMVPLNHSTHATRRKEGAAYNGWGIVPGNGAPPEVNDPVGLVSPQGDFSKR